MIRMDYLVTYRFTADDGQSYSSEVDVSQNFYFSVEIGASTPVRYLPDDPARSEIEFGHATAKNYAGLVFGGIFMLFGLGCTGMTLFMPPARRKSARRSSLPSPP